MIHFTRYAHNKFGVLERHGFSVSREVVSRAVALPDSVDESRRPLFAYQKNIHERIALRVICRQEDGVARVITFYPVRSKKDRPTV